MITLLRGRAPRRRSRPAAGCLAERPAAGARKRRRSPFLYEARDARVGRACGRHGPCRRRPRRQGVGRASAGATPGCFGNGLRRSRRARARPFVSSAPSPPIHPNRTPPSVPRRCYALAAPRAAAAGARWGCRAVALAFFRRCCWPGFGWGPRQARRRPGHTSGPSRCLQCGCRCLAAASLTGRPMMARVHRQPSMYA
jgi:hypothetical protein